MKVRVMKEFKDKHTGELHKIGTEPEMSVERINEVLKVGNFIELIEHTEPIEPPQEEPELPPDEEATDGDGGAEELLDETKTAGRRKRNK